MRGFTIVIIISVVLLAGCAPETLTPAETSLASESRVPLDAEVAVAWGNKHVLPAIDRGLEDPIPAIKRLIKRLVHMSEADITITMDTDPQNPEALANTLWNKGKGKPDIYINTAMLMEIEPTLAVNQFQDLVLAVLCHEMLHLESRMPTSEDPKGSSVEGKEILWAQESIVWARTVEEIIRPLQKADRYVSPQAARIEQAFTVCGNTDGPIWRNWVMVN